MRIDFTRNRALLDGAEGWGQVLGLDHSYEGLSLLRSGAQAYQGFDAGGLFRGDAEAPASWQEAGEAPRELLAAWTDVGLTILRRVGADWERWQHWDRVSAIEGGEALFLDGDADAALPGPLGPYIGTERGGGVKVCDSGFLLWDHGNLVHVDLATDRVYAYSSAGVRRSRLIAGVRPELVGGWVDFFDPVDADSLGVTLPENVGPTASSALAYRRAGFTEYVSFAQGLTLTWMSRDLSVPGGEFRVYSQYIPLVERPAVRWTSTHILPNGDTLVAGSDTDQNAWIVRFPARVADPSEWLSVFRGVPASAPMLAVTPERVYVNLDKGLAVVEGAPSALRAASTVRMLAVARGQDLGVDADNESLDSPGEGGFFYGVRATRTHVFLYLYAGSLGEGTLLSVYDADARRALWRRWYPGIIKAASLSFSVELASPVVSPGTTPSPPPGYGPDDPEI